MLFNLIVTENANKTTPTQNQTSMGMVKDGFEAQQVLGEDHVRVNQGITSYQDTLGTACSEVPKEYGMKSDPTYPSAPYLSMFDRPIEVATGTLDPTNVTALKWLAAWRLPDIMFNSTNIRSLLTQHRYWRFDIEVTIRVVATRFHSGMLMFAHHPKSENGASTCHYNAVNAFQVPHTMIDLSEGGSATLVCKWYSPKEWMDISKFSTGQAALYERMGLLTLYSLSKIYHPTSATVPYQIFMRPINVTCDGPTLNDFTWATTPDYGPFSSPVIYDTLMSQIHSSPFNHELEDYAPVERQMDREQSQKSQKHVMTASPESTPSFVKTIGDTATDILSTVEKLSPLISAVALDKPRAMVSDQPVFQRMPWMLASGLAHYDPSTYFPESKMRAHKSCIRDEDEMKLDYLYHKPGLIYTGTITDTQSAGTVLKTFAVTPADCISAKTSTITSALARINLNTPLSYLSYCFNMWRGSLRYNITFQASSFHSCRVAIYWMPLNPNGSLSSSAWTTFSGLVPLQYIDINGPTSVDFTIPWCSANDYLSTYSNSEYRCMNGAFAVRLIAPLRSSMAGMSEIGYFLTVQGGDDFHYAHPRMPQRWDMCDKTYSTSFSDDLQLEDYAPVKRQVIGCDVDRSKNKELALNGEFHQRKFFLGGSAPELPLSVLHLTSKPFRSMFIRLSYILTDTKHYGYHFFPLSRPVNEINNAKSIRCLLNYNMPFFMAQMYGWWRGGFDIAYYNGGSGTNTNRWGVSHRYIYDTTGHSLIYENSVLKDGISIDQSYGTYLGTSPHHISLQADPNVPLYVSCPYYSLLPYQPTIHCTDTTRVNNANDAYFEKVNAPLIMPEADSAADIVYDIHAITSTSDDFEFACYLGVPSTLVNVSKLRVDFPFEFDYPD